MHVKSLHVAGVAEDELYQKAKEREPCGQRVTEGIACEIVAAYSNPNQMS